jgi:hypothetical protein
MTAPTPASAPSPVASAALATGNVRRSPPAPATTPAATAAAPAAGAGAASSPAPAPAAASVAVTARTFGAAMAAAAATAAAASAAAASLRPCLRVCLCLCLWRCRFRCLWGRGRRRVPAPERQRHTGRRRLRLLRRQCVLDCQFARPLLPLPLPLRLVFPVEREAGCALAHLMRQPQRPP